MISPYKKCPVYENEKYLLRMVEASDAADLLLVYSDEKAVPFFNSDNCNGDDFHYTSLERMKKAIEYWRWEYDREGFVRWSIIDKELKKAIGTIELFHRISDDYFNNCGIMRLDLRSNYEKKESIFEILSLIIPSSFELFDCRIIATKIPPFASERKAAAEKAGFIGTSQKLIGGHDKKSYTDYFVLQK